MKRLLLVLSLLFPLLLVAEDPKSTHNMLVFGTNPIYLSHLPAFSMKVHRYQGIYEVTFGEEGDKKYREHKRKSKKLLYGLAPSAFVLPKIKADSKFSGRLIADHPESGTAPFAAVDVKVVKRVHFHSFNDSTERPTALTYISVGSGEEQFLVHWLTTPTVLPDRNDQFDHIVPVSVKDREGKSFKVPEGSWVLFPDRKDNFGERLNRPDEDVASYTGIAVAPTGPKTVDFVTGKDIRLHTGGDVIVRPRR